MSNFREAERRAPVDTSGPLPARVQSLEFIPASAHWQYFRTMDGGFRLARLVRGDAASYFAHAEGIASGEIEELAEGTTSESYEAAKRADAEKQARITAAIAEAEVIQRQENEERAAAAAERRERAAALERERASRGMLTASDMQLLRQTATEGQ